MGTPRWQQQWRVAVTAIVALFVVLVVAMIPAAGAATGPVGGQGRLAYGATGLLPPTPEEKAWMATHVIPTTNVALNDIGLQRLNAERHAKMLPMMPSILAVPRGLEVTGATAINKAVALPTKVDNSQLKYFPPIGSQGGIGSCACYSTTYYTMTHMVAMARDIDAAHGGDDTHYSTKWTYNLINGGQDKGSSAGGAYRVMLDHGAATEKDFPYIGSTSPPSNYLQWCTDAAVWRKAINVRMATTGYVGSLNSDSGLAAAKALLASGYLMNYATNIFNWQFTYVKRDPTLRDNDNCTGAAACHWAAYHYDADGKIADGGAHEMTIVGYNDTLWIDVNNNGRVDPGERGAFLICNSWGTGWGNSGGAGQTGGFMWVSYDALKSTPAVTNGPVKVTTNGITYYRETVFSGAEWITARASYTPTYTVKVTLTSAIRSKIRAGIGTSDLSGTKPNNTWTPFAVSGVGGGYNFSGFTGAASGSFTLDFTDQAKGVALPARWFVEVSSSDTKNPTTITALQLTDESNGLTSTAQDLPQTVESGSSTYPSVIDPFVDYPSMHMYVASHVEPRSAPTNATVDYTINYANIGVGDASNVTIVDTLPNTLSYVPDSASDGGVYDVFTNTITWTLPTVPVNTLGQLTFQMSVDQQSSGYLTDAPTLSATELAAPISGISSRLYVQGLTDADGYMFRHDQFHTGRSPNTGIGPGYKKWVYTTGDAIHSSPVIGADGTIYVGSQDGTFYAVNPDGTQQWAFPTALPVVSSPALAPDGTIYIGSGNTFLYALKANGDKLWEFQAGDQINTAPVLGADGTVYVGSEDGSLYAVSADGVQEWAFDAGGPVESSPAVGIDGVIYFGARDLQNTLYALNADGSQRWALSTGGAIVSAPTIGSDGTVYVAAGATLYAVDRTGSILWSTALGDVILSSPALGTRTARSTSGNDRKLYAIAPDGTIVWTYKTGRELYASPTVGADGMIYIGSWDNKLYAITPDGQLSWLYTTGKGIVSSANIGTDGTIYVGSNDGNLYALFPGNVVTPSAGPNGDISPNTPQTVDNQASLLFTATPLTGFSVDTWSVDDNPVQTGGLTYTLSNITAGHTVSVTFTVQTFTVTPSAGPHGAVAPNTGQTVNYNDSITFNATPDPNYAVAVWKLDNAVVQTGGLSYQLSNVTANHTVDVSFLPTFTITPSTGGNGTIAPNLPQVMAQGDQILFTASPDTGFVVDTWYLDTTQTVQTGGTTYTLTNIQADHAVKVTFKVATFKVTPSAGLNGTVSPSTQQTVNYNDSLVFTAKPATGYAVDTWCVDNVVAQTGNNSFTLATITADHAVKVTFVRVFTITPSADNTGSISPNTVQQVTRGGSVTFNASPNTGYLVNTWVVDNLVRQTGGASYTLTNIVVDHKVRVTFVKAAVVTPVAGPNGSITPNTVQSVKPNTAVTLTATPDTGYRVDTWYVNGIRRQIGGLSLRIVASAVPQTVRVTFKK